MFIIIINVEETSEKKTGRTDELTSQLTRHTNTKINNNAVSYLQSVRVLCLHIEK